MSIVIVGAGSVGLCTAIMLKKAGRDVTLVSSFFPDPLNSQQGSVANSAKVVFLNRHSLQILAEQLEIDVEHNSMMPVAHLAVRDANSTGNFSVSALDEGLENLGVVVPDIELQHLMWQQVQALGIETITGEVQGLAQPQQADQPIRRVTIRQAGSNNNQDTNQNNSIDANLVIACDGLQSACANMAGLVSQREKTSHSSLICCVKTNRAHQGRAVQFFHQEGTVAALPLRDAGASEHSWYNIIYSASDRDIARLQDLPSDALQALLHRKLEGEIGQIEQLGTVAVRPLYEHRRRNVAKALVLLGDAWHAMHPLAGQGLNSALEDVEGLCQCLQQYEMQIALDKWMTRKALQHDVAAVLNDSLLALHRSHNPALRWLRARGMGVVQHTPALKSALVKVASGHWNMG